MLRDLFANVEAVSLVKSFVSSVGRIALALEAIAAHDKARLFREEQDREAAQRAAVDE